MKPIETIYNGYRFRSRLEARWAVLFDELGVPYEYESEGFVLDDGTPYLPDFWLPNQKMWAEVKPLDASIILSKEWEKVEAFSRHQRIYGIFGPPRPPETNEFYCVIMDKGKILGLVDTPGDDGMDISTRLFILELTYTFDQRLDKWNQAALTACQARFGKNGRG